MSNILYNGTHSIQITVNGTNYNTWTSWGLIPTPRPFVAIPQPKLNIVSIPGTNNLLDLTDLTSGGLTFGERSGEWTFIIDYEKWSNWVSPVDSIRNAIHGKKVTVRLVDDPTKEYTGRMSVSGYSPGSNYSTITLSYVFSSGYTDNTSSIVDPSQGGWQGGGSGGDSGNGGSSSGGGSGGGNSGGGSVTPTPTPTPSSDPNSVPSGAILLNSGTGKADSSTSEIRNSYLIANSRTQIPSSYYKNDGKYCQVLIRVYGDSGYYYKGFLATSNNLLSYEDLTFRVISTTSDNATARGTNYVATVTGSSYTQVYIGCSNDDYSYIDNITYYIYVIP